MSDLQSLARNFRIRDGAQGVPAIGPGAARKCPDGVSLAETARVRKAAKPAWRMVWCGFGCPGHEDDTRCR